MSFNSISIGGVHDASEIPIRFSQEKEANGRGKIASRRAGDTV